MDKTPKNPTSQQNQIAELKSGLNLLVLSTDGTLFEGRVRALTCMNDAGEFNVLPMHSNFISLIYNSVNIELFDSTTKIIHFGRSLLKVIFNDVTILTNIDISVYDEAVSIHHKPHPSSEVSSTTS